MCNVYRDETSLSTDEGEKEESNNGRDEKEMWKSVRCDEVLSEARNRRLSGKREFSGKV